ncbi:MAG: IMP dehydrogenase [Candidatus Magasanikbacteria bacterium]|nr:IMP dehydrogenase [Candidatus Magasanikbacteria bacterium]
MNIPLALTYDDVLIVPRRSSLDSRQEANISTKLTKKLNLKIPIISSNMDTVTESEMAIALARLGGIGIMHRFMSIEDNAEEVRRVKRAQNFVIKHPYTIEPDKTLREAKEFIANCGVGGILVANGDGRLRGILSSRDILFAESDEQRVHEIMTPRGRLFVGSPDTSFREAKEILGQRKVEKLPLVDLDDKICGLIISDDIKNQMEYPLANTDEEGRLIVGASVGVKGDYIERAQALLEAGADVLVIDIAHGHSELMFKAIKNIRESCGDIQLIAGNIATAQGARDLCEAGVDAIKVGVGPGTICVTRMVTGCGVPQLSAVMNAVAAAKPYGVPVIADGGIQKSGDIVKAIGAGADTVMIGGMFAGTHESPGIIMNRNGKKYKVCRGSASFGTAERRRSLGQEKRDLSEVTPEGVEAIVPYKGYLKEIVGQLTGGLRSGMSYTNSRSIAELQENCQFLRVTSAGLKESGAHDLEEVR